jgi:hypothetical protein
MSSQPPVDQIMPALSPVVERLSGFLEQQPTDFEITILSGSDETKRRLSVDESIVLHGQHLGLEARSLPWLTQAIRQDYKRLRNSTKESGMLLLTVTSCLLLVNPDHATAWADRRRCLVNQQQQQQGNNGGGWKNELKYLNLLLTQHSKA